MEPRFDVEDVFDDDYLYFYGDRLAQIADDQADLIWRLLELESGMDVLDVPCGHGRITNRLAARGCCVTGLDATPRFLDLARRDAAERGVEVTYVHADMRALEWTGTFDRAVNWFSSFGYFTDEENHQVLAEAHRALRPGGRLLIETLHQPQDPHDADRGPGRQEPHDAVLRPCPRLPGATRLAAGSRVLARGRLRSGRRAAHRRQPAHARHSHPVSQRKIAER